MSDQMPPHYTLKLYTAAEHQKLTYFHLDADDTLHFAGGKDAVTRAARPLLKITPGQRQELWNLIVKYNLHHASGELFPSRERVQYDFSLNSGGASLGHSYSAADDDVPGLAQLHAHLLSLRSTVRLDSPLPGPD